MKTTGKRVFEWFADLLGQLYVFLLAVFDLRNIATTLTILLFSLLFVYGFFVSMGYEHLFGVRWRAIKTCSAIDNWPAFLILFLSSVFIISAVMAVGASLHYVWSKMHRVFDAERAATIKTFFVSGLCAASSGVAAIYRIARKAPSFRAGMNSAEAVGIHLRFL